MNRTTGQSGGGASRVAGVALLLILATGLARATEPSAPDVSATAPDAEATAPGATAPEAAAPDLVADALGPIPPDDPRNLDYAHGYYRLYVVDAAVTLAFFWIVLASGLSASLQRLTERLTRPLALRIALFVVLLLLMKSAVDLPIDLWVFFREKRYGFMNQGPVAWFGDRTKVLLIAMALQALFFPLLYAAIRRMGKRWWMAGSALATVFVVVGMVIAPVFFAPLFNTFTPLRDGALRAEILALAHAQGIPADEVYEVDASRQSEHVNAYVAGMLGTERIVLYDTLLRRFEPREIRAVMGHEMGHYVLNHVWKTVALIAGVIVAALYGVDRLARRILRARPRWRIAGLEEAASLPLILFLVALFSLAARPAIYAWSRHQERAADEFALNVVRDPEAAASVYRKFALIDLDEMHVDPWIEALLYSHPSIARRVEHARTWAREHPPESR